MYDRYQTDLFDRYAATVVFVVEANHKLRTTKCGACMWLIILALLCSGYGYAVLLAR